MLLPAFIIYQKSVEHIYEQHPVLYIYAFGMVAAKVTNKLVASTTRFNINLRNYKTSKGILSKQMALLEARLTMIANNVVFLQNFAKKINLGIIRILVTRWRT